MYYTVGTQSFTNKFLAAAEAIKTGHEIKFNLYDTAFLAADWSKEPDLTWDQLLDIRANQIAAKGKPIVLNFSGGTDSYTIYKVFERNKIHIDLLYLRRRKTDADAIINKKLMELLNQGIYDKTTKIVIREDDADMFKKAYSDENWLWENKARAEFSYGFNSDWTTESYISELLGTDDYISVVGFEKPRLYFTWHGAYSYQLDIPFTRVVGSSTLDSFYITPELPELHIKQSYLMLNHIRRKHPYATPRDLYAYNDFQDPTKFSWDEFALASGRFGDLSMSGAVHTAWQGLSLTLPTDGKFYGHEHTGPGSNWFKSIAGTDLFENYTRGILSVASDPVYKYLSTDANNFYKLKGYHSQHHKLNFPIQRKPT